MGWMEFEPPPSPPCFKPTSVLKSRGFFIAKAMDGEFGVFTISELPVQINSLDIKFPELSIFTK
jgi:hypothetical protein